MIFLKVADISREEIKQAVRIQISELSQGFLSSFGERPLTLIFEHVAKSRWGIFVAAVDEESGRVAGYVFGAENTGRLYRNFIITKTAIAVAYFLPKMLTLGRIKKACETLFYPATKTSEDLPEAELLDLAVTKQYQGRGVAQMLFEKFVSECKVRRIGVFKIPTSASLPQAHRFYEKMGAVKAGLMEVHKGEATLIYIYRT